jgi:iron complex outermembrane receptor protein
MMRQNGDHLAASHSVVRISLLLAVLPLMLFASMPAPAADLPPEETKLEDMSLEQLLEVTIEKVYGASKFEQTVTEAPASVTVMTADDIKSYGWRTLADLLNASRGFFSSYDRNYQYIGVRGFNRPGDYNSRVLLLVDGHRLNDNIYNTAAIGTDFPLDLALIERVEIIRGPSSSLYGTSAFFGVISITTRSPQKMVGMETSVVIGDQSTYQGRLSFAKAFQGDGELLISASGYTSDGDSHIFSPELAQSTGVGTANNMDRDRSYSFFAKALFGDFTLTGIWHNREKRVPTAAFQSLPDNSALRTIDNRGFLDLKFERAVSGTQLLARLFLDEYRYDGKFPYDYSPGGPSLVVNHDDVIGRWWGGELQASRRFNDWLHLTAGTEFTDNFQQDQTNRDEYVGGNSVAELHSSTVWSLYSQVEVRLHPKLILNAGVRHDQYSTFGGNTSPRGALIFTPLEKTVFKATYGEAFRAPNAFELHYQDVFGTFIPNPALNPEKIRTAELTYEQYYGDYLRSSVSGYYAWISDLITYQNGVPWDNIDKIETAGAEVEIEGRWKNGIAARVSYAFAEARNEKSDQHLDNSPQHLAKLNVTLPLYLKLLSAGVEVQWVGQRDYLEKVDRNGNTVPSGSVNSYMVSNLTLLSTGLRPGLDLSASIYNIFDKKYDDPASSDLDQAKIHQDGRTFRLKLTYRF